MLCFTVTLLCRVGLHAAPKIYSVKRTPIALFESGDYALFVQWNSHHGNSIVISDTNSSTTIQKFRLIDISACKKALSVSELEEETRLSRRAGQP
jgi:hypothetical protein